MEPDLTNCVLNTEAPLETHWSTVSTLGELRTLLIDRTLDDDVDSARHVARILWMKFVDKFGVSTVDCPADWFEKFQLYRTEPGPVPSWATTGNFVRIELCVWNEVPARLAKETIPSQNAVVPLTKSKMEQIYQVEEIPDGFFDIFVVTYRILHVCKIHGNRLLLKMDLIMVLTEEDTINGDLELIEFCLQNIHKIAVPGWKRVVSYESPEAEWVFFQLGE